MSDLIKRDDALDALQIVGAWSTKEQRRALSQAYDKLHRVPAVDAVPVEHAKLIGVIQEEYYRPFGECSRCGFENFGESKLCCMCGAKFDGGEGDDRV